MGPAMKSKVTNSIREQPYSLEINTETFTEKVMKYTTHSQVARKKLRIYI